jgi:hypothetical protein
MANMSTQLLDFIEITPEVGIPPVAPEKYLDLRERAIAACETAKDLQSYGLDLDTVTPHDEEVAHLLAAAYAKDPEHASKTVTDARLCDMTPASLVLTGSILDEFGRLVVKDSQRLRYLVTNKLIIESENPDARVRLRALEMLGKISDVGLFTEKKEIEITHRSSAELYEVMES